MACRGVALCGAAITFLAAVDGAGATAPAYVTPMMAHTAWTATENCKPVAGVSTLPAVSDGAVTLTVPDRRYRRVARHRRRDRSSISQA